MGKEWLEQWFLSLNQVRITWRTVKKKRRRRRRRRSIRFLGWPQFHRIKFFGSWGQEIHS